MTRRVRVLIVDDSVTIRRLVSDLVASQADLEVAGVAPSGRIALAKIPQVCPDVVTLDVEMPDLDGLQTLAEIRKTHPRLPVIMFSSVTERAAAATLEALALGANDYVTKPAGSTGLAGAIERVREQLLPKIRELGAQAPAISSVPRRGSIGTSINPALGSSPVSGAPSLLAPPVRSIPAPVLRSVPTPVVRSIPAPPALPRSTPSLGARPIPSLGARSIPARSIPPPGGGGIEIIAIGCSTGGPNALTQMFSALPPDLSVPIVITQHMPPIFTKLLAERLSASTRVVVHEAKDGDVLAPGQAWLAPGDHHMDLQRTGSEVRVVLNQEPPENSCRPSVDVMLRGVARVYGTRSLSVILTGMGQDGLRGCQDLYDLGAEIIVQDEATSVVWGMPGFVARAGLAAAVLPIDAMAGEIILRARRRGPGGITSERSA